MTMLKTISSRANKTIGNRKHYFKPFNYVQLNS